jgi:hypothetical protein
MPIDRADRSTPFRFAMVMTENTVAASAKQVERETKIGPAPYQHRFARTPAENNGSGHADTVCLRTVANEGHHDV